MGQRSIIRYQRDCNWLQGLEGGIDTSHVPVLHRVLSADSTRPGFKPGDPFVRGKIANMHAGVAQAPTGLPAPTYSYTSGMATSSAARRPSAAARCWTAALTLMNPPRRWGSTPRLRFTFATATSR